MALTAPTKSAAVRAYGELVAALARGEERDLGELLTVAAAVGKTTNDVAADVEALADLVEATASGGW